MSQCYKLNFSIPVLNPLKNKLIGPSIWKLSLKWLIRNIKHLLIPFPYVLATMICTYWSQCYNILKLFIFLLPEVLANFNDSRLLGISYIKLMELSIIMARLFSCQWYQKKPRSQCYTMKQSQNTNNKFIDYKYWIKYKKYDLQCIKLIANIWLSSVPTLYRDTAQKVTLWHPSKKAFLFVVTCIWVSVPVLMFIKNHIFH